MQMRLIRWGGCMGSDGVIFNDFPVWSMVIDGGICWHYWKKDTYRNTTSNLSRQREYIVRPHS